MRECDRSEWAKFRRYHYLNSDLSNAAKCYGLYDVDEIIAFIAVVHQPNKNSRIKRVTRLVVHPDYQGIGIGTKFLNVIAKMYSEKGYDFSIVTSAKNLIRSLLHDKHWILTRYSANRCANQSKIMTKKTASFQPTIRNKCKTSSFFYKR